MTKKLFAALYAQYEKLDRAIRLYVSSVLGAASASYSSSNIFGMIINIIRGIWQNAFLYLEDSVQEQNIATATRKRSISSLARLSGYEPFYGSAATGLLDLSIMPNNLAYTSKVVIPDRTRVKHVGTGKLYMTDSGKGNLTVSLGNMFRQRSIPIVQGVFSGVSWKSSGIPLEAFSVNARGAYDINYTRVYVNGERWERHSCLYDMSGDTKGFVISQSFDGDFSVVFGNGVHGAIPPSGATVECEYLVHRGEFGNLTVSDDDRFIFYDSILDGNGEPISGNEIFTLRRNGAVCGGMEAESIESIRKNIGRNSRSGVLASVENYELLLSRFSFVGHYKVWSDTNSMEIKMNVLRDVTSSLESGSEYFRLMPEDFLLGDERKELIKNTIENSSRAFAGTALSFVDPVIRNYAAVLYVKKEPEYEDEVVRREISEAVGSMFASLKKDVLYIAKSAVIDAVLASSEGVTSADMIFVSRDNEEAFLRGYYERYRRQWRDGVYQDIKETVQYDPGNPVGLDAWSNIELESPFEFPVLLGGFVFCPDKTKKTETVTLDALNIFFV